MPGGDTGAVKWVSPGTRVTSWAQVARDLPACSSESLVPWEAPQSWVKHPIKAVSFLVLVGLPIWYLNCYRSHLIS